MADFNTTVYKAVSQYLTDMSQTVPKTLNDALLKACKVWLTANSIPFSNFAALNDLMFLVANQFLVKYGQPRRGDLNTAVFFALQTFLTNRGISPIPKQFNDLVLLAGSKYQFTWQPENLGSRLVGWLDATDNSTITLASGAVDKWKDKVSGAEFAAASSGLRPTLTTVNGRQALLFNGNKQLDFAGVPTSWPVGGSYGEFIALTRDYYTGNNLTNIIWMGEAVGAGFRELRRTGTSGRFQAQINVGGASRITPGFINNFPQVWTGTYGSATNALNVGSNNNFVTPTTFAVNTGTTITSIGSDAAGTARWQGEIFHVFIVNAPLTTLERAQIQTWLEANGRVPAWSPKAQLGDKLKFQVWPGYSEVETATGGLLTTVYDDVTKRAVTQATSGFKPVAAGNIFGTGSRPGLQPDGTDDYISAIDSNMPTVPIDIWLLIDQTVAASNTDESVIFAFGSSSTNNRVDIRRIVDTGVNRARLHVGTGSGQTVVVNTNADFSGVCLVRARITATTSSIEVNQVASSDVSIVPSIGTGRWTLFSNTSAQFASCILGYVGVSSPLTGTDETNMYAFLESLKT